MNYSIPIILSLIIVIFCVCFLLFANGVIKMPEIKTEIPLSKIDEIFKELESMPVSEVQKLKIRLEKIFKKQDVIMPVLP